MSPIAYSAARGLCVALLLHSYALLRATNTEVRSRLCEIIVLRLRCCV